MVIGLALLAFLMTLAGGAFALRFRHHLLPIMGFSAGLLIGVVFLDLIPEVFEMVSARGDDIHAPMIVLLAGFIGIFLLEKLTLIHGEKQHDAPGHVHNVGLAGAVGLTFHSLLDGVAIGVGFQAGGAVGFTILLAVLAHDFADGLNTVTIMLATRNTKWRTIALLLINASAPVVGAALTRVLEIPQSWIAYQLSFFAGFLLYLGASDLLPEVHQRPKAALIFSTLGGVTVAAVMVYALHHFSP
ncbi:MAG TPA: ZIP family metal transporter [Thermoanaerobaculia bacterium]|nr:ZIP family metal transporter [Thermoanaerobaculia bacterium]